MTNQCYNSPMRLTHEQIQTIRQITRELAGKDARVPLFGSRLDNQARGGDVDLLLDLPNNVANPAVLASRIAARISRSMDDRKVDVVLSAPNLKKLPIHEIALKEGKEL